MRLISWLIRAFIFFTLFAFALNNQQTATVHWFFGVQWRAPMVIIVLIAFAAGCALGILAMLPGWWRQRSIHNPLRRRSDPKPAPAGTVPAAATGAGLNTAVDRTPRPDGI
jgi:putative membrane protein